MSDKPRSDAVWKWVAGCVMALLIAVLGAYTADNLKYFRDGATRTEVRRMEEQFTARHDLMTQRIDDAGRSLASLTANVLATLRSVESTLTRLETEIRELRGAQHKPTGP